MSSRHYKFQRQQFEYANQRQRLTIAESRFRKDVQSQLQQRAERRQVTLSSGGACTKEDMAKGIKQLRMTNELRGQLAYIQRLRRVLKLEDTTPLGVVQGAS